MKVDREQEFAPIKNAEGSEEDSPNTARFLIADMSCKWIEDNGGNISVCSDSNYNNPMIEFDIMLTLEGEGLESIKGKKFMKTNYITAQNMMQSWA